MATRPPRPPVPQLDGGLFLTDAGLETVLVFHHGVDLEGFAAFPLVASDEGRERLRGYYLPLLKLADEVRAGFVLEAPTWRANPDWGRTLGWGRGEHDRVNRDAITLMMELRSEAPEVRVVVSGCIGPRGDGYRVDHVMTAVEAHRYHAPQIETFADSPADMVAALTIGNTCEAIGIARAAVEADIPAAISFTVETDGRLPSGEALGEAIDVVDQATSGSPSYYMVNCAHPTHLGGALTTLGSWTERVRGLRANASTRSHAELDESTELDDGDPADLAARYVALRLVLPRLNVLGGCCGTDLRHIDAIARAWVKAE